MLERVAIVGSRAFCTTCADHNFFRVPPHTCRLDEVRSYVASLPVGTTVISGGAKGVDQAAEGAANDRGLKVLIFRPDWAMLGRRAGFDRNIKIVRSSQRVVAFWDGKSRGTEHSISIARQLARPIEIIR